MKILIIEDEKPAAEKLQKALAKADPGIHLTGVLNSVSASVDWLKNNAQPDLVMMDIELTDGLSFKIFDSVQLSCPIIFTTAFDEYWQEAFEHNGIDYLLKPVKQDKLEFALKKYHSLQKHFAANLQQLLQWQQQSPVNNYKKRFLVKRGIDYVAVKTDDIAYCYATHKLVCMVDVQNQKFILDKSLADLEKELDPTPILPDQPEIFCEHQRSKKDTIYWKRKIMGGIIARY
jgi:DNA-binding LytR/AlgR family response regulator